jgi:hypothetical protein
MTLKPQDFLVALKLLAIGNRHWTYASLAHELGVSASETHAAVKRGLAARLLSDASLGLASVAPASAAAFAARKPGLGLSDAYSISASGKSASARSNLDNAAVVDRRNLAEFAVHGAKYVFAPERLPVGPGVPTSHAAPAFAGVFAAGHEPLVWPDANGAVRGEGLLPLHPCVPGAAMRDAALYELLALFDALRAGRARERGMAANRLQKLIAPPQAANELATAKSGMRPHRG